MVSRCAVVIIPGTNTECCTPETNTTFHADCISNKKNLRRLNRSLPLPGVVRSTQRDLLPPVASPLLTEILGGGVFQRGRHGGLLSPTLPATPPRVGVGPAASPPSSWSARAQVPHWGPRGGVR